MPESLKKIIIRLLPEPVERMLRKLAGRPEVAVDAGSEKSSEWYDRTFEEISDYSTHYTQSSYYVSWTVIIDRIRRAGSKSVLEVACGPGQLACALRDSGLIDRYHGFDFSGKRVQGARKACPDYRFDVADALMTNLFVSVDYDVVIATEFLEHIEEDLRVVARIRTGARFIGTVPNYPYESHVRHFNDSAAVAERYANYFDDYSIAPIIRDERGHILYIMEGIKRSNAA